MGDLGTIYNEAFDLKDRYAQFLDEQDRLAPIGDLQEFTHLRTPGSTAYYGETIGTGQFTVVQNYTLVLDNGAHLPKVRRIHPHGLEPTARAIAQRKQDLARTEKIDYDTIESGIAFDTFMIKRGKERRRLQEEIGKLTASMAAPHAAYVEHVGRLLGLALDKRLGECIAPIEGYTLGPVRIDPEKEEEDALVLYQERANATLRDRFRQVAASPRAIADLVDATADLAERLRAADYIDTDFKGDNIGVFTINGQPALRIFDVAELRPYGEFLDRLRAFIKRVPSAAPLEPKSVLGTPLYLPARYLASDSPQEQYAPRPGDAAVSLATTIASDLLGMYDGLKERLGHADIYDTMLAARMHFVKQPTAPRMLAPYCAPIAATIMDDLTGKEPDLSTLLDGLRAASDEVRVNKTSVTVTMPTASPGSTVPVRQATPSGPYRTVACATSP